jgi:hypothetical protein
MVHLLFFTDISQFHYVQFNSPELFERMMPVTNNMVVAFELERLGIEFIDEWSFLKPDDIEKNRNLAHELSKIWWDEHLASTEYEGFALTDVAQQDLVYAFEASLNARTVYKRLFDTYSVSEISGYFLPLVAVVRTGPAPTSQAVTSVSQAILFYMAEQRGIAVDKLALPSPPSNDRKRKLSFGSITRRANITIANSGAEVRKTVLIYESGMPVLEHESLCQALGNLSNVRIVSISQRALEMPTSIKNNYSDIRDRLEIFWKVFVDSLEYYRGDYPELFANKNLLFQFEGIKKEMEVATEYGNVFKSFLDMLKPEMVIFGHEAFTVERALVKLAQNKNIPTLGMVHGGLGCKSQYRGLVGDADSILVWSDVDIAGLMSFGIGQARLIKIGCIRYENKFVGFTKDNGIDYLLPKRKAKNRLGVEQDKPLIVLLTAEVNTGLAAPVADPRNHRVALMEFLSLVKSRPDLQFVIKAHPTYDYFQLYREMLHSQLPNLVFNEQLTLSDVLAASDICLMINYCTTAALEAMLCRIPVVYFNNAVYPLDDWRDMLSEKSVCRVSTIIDVELAVDNILTNQPVRQAILIEAEKQVKVTLGVGELSAKNRLIDVMDELLNRHKVSNSTRLCNAELMQEFLYSLDAQVVQQRKDIFSKHTITSLMYSLVYLAGIYNLGVSSVARIYEIVNSKENGEKIILWKDARWELLQQYILASFTTQASINFSRLGVLTSYFFYPYRFFLSPSVFKRLVAKYLMQNVFAVYDQICCFIRKTIFKLSAPIIFLCRNK